MDNFNDLILIFIGLTLRGSPSVINYVIQVVTYAVSVFHDLRWQEMLRDYNSLLFHIIQGRIRDICRGERDKWIVKRCQLVN